MDVVHEDWKVRQSIYFDGAEFGAHRSAGADVLIVEADLVHAEVLDSCPLVMIGCCRGDPVNIDLERATAGHTRLPHPGTERRCRRRPDARFPADARPPPRPAQDTFRRGGERVRVPAIS
jgi:hypothetical protein